MSCRRTGCAFPESLQGDTAGSVDASRHCSWHAVRPSRTIELVSPPPPGFQTKFMAARTEK